MFVMGDLQASYCVGGGAMGSLPGKLLPMKAMYFDLSLLTTIFQNHLKIFWDYIKTCVQRPPLGDGKCYH